MTRILDGGLATTLQADGLPKWTPVDEWVLSKQDRVQAAHEKFIEAGSEIILAATFRALPHLTPNWDAVAVKAMAAATAATEGTRAEAWASIGPGSTRDQTWLDLPAARRYTLNASWRDLAAKALAHGAKGIALETFVDPYEAVEAVESVRAVAHKKIPVSASLVAGPDGCLMDGSPPYAHLNALSEAGATIVGFNCGGSVEQILQTLSWCKEIDAPIWLKPGRIKEDSDAQVLATLQAISEVADYVGGCCGVGPQLIEQLALATA
ncbi:MAG: homocysteine S-methyltransferase family protein [Proteobacteria bacterium]|nr:homocysteine S-methyltransferase family protein [Pseudomonadota bacterium]